MATCKHLDHIRDVVPSADGCEDCLKIGGSFAGISLRGDAAASETKDWSGRRSAPPAHFHCRAPVFSKSVSIRRPSGNQKPLGPSISDWTVMRAGVWSGEKRRKCEASS
jgi:hypothetical protein